MHVSPVAGGRVDAAVLLDGFIGALVGGLVTGVAVMVTLMHERRKERRGRVVDAAASVMALSQRLAIETDVRPEADNGRLFADLLQQSLMLTAHAMTMRRSILGAVVTDLALRINKVGSGITDPATAAAASPELWRLLAALQASLGRWIAGPSRFDRRRPRTLWCRKQDPVEVVKAIISQTPLKPGASVAGEETQP